MGLFGFVKKALGKVAKAGLSAITHGASDVVLRSLKRTGGTTKNPVHRSGLSPAQDQALIAKLTPVVPRVIATERVLEQAQSGVNTYGAARAHARKRMPGGKRSAALDRYLRTMGGTEADMIPGERATGAAARKRLAGIRRERKAQGGSKRRLTPAMQAMANRSKQLAAQWRALGGRDGTGQSFFDWKRGK